MVRFTGVDILGDVLREFYEVFGNIDEGPPAGFDVTGALGSRLGQIDVEPLRELLANADARKQVCDCRELLDELLTRLGTEELLREISQTPMPVGRTLDELAKGLFWLTLARNLDRREGGLPVTPFDDRLNIPLPVKVMMTVEGSLVLQLYIALVYMRHGPLAELVREGARARKPCCGRVIKLLDLDFVRRVRNALSHGSFSACCAGIIFQDKDTETGSHLAATPGFLRRLCDVLMLVDLQAVAAARAPLTSDGARWQDRPN